MLVANRQVRSFSNTQLRDLVREVLTDHGVSEAEISVAIVDDKEIHDLNQRFLQHDYPTDVLSFVLERDGSRLEGEIVASAETAARCADEYGGSAEHELLLYVLHGTLHLVGYDDHSPADRQQMRAREQEYLQRQGIVVPLPEERSTATGKLQQGR